MAGDDLNFPFEPSPPTPILDQDLLLSGGVVVAAVALNDTLPGIGRWLLKRFGGDR